MTTKESNEIMRYVGRIEGLALTIIPDDESESDYIKQTLLDIASDLEAVVKGVDDWKGGGENDV